MSNNIEDKKGNYEVVRNILSSRYQEVNGYDFLDECDLFRGGCTKSKKKMLK